MKKIIALIVIIICFSTHAQKGKTVYFPQVFFDKKEASNLLAEGKSTIEGVAFTRKKNMYGFKPLLAEKQYAKEGTVVMLFPCSTYFDEWYRLRNKYENKTTAVFMSQEAFEYRLEAKTDAYGRFKFTNIKPGKYYLETIIDFTAVGSYDEQVGNTNYYNGYGAYVGSSPIYKKYYYNYTLENREYEFVEINRDGELIEMKLK